MIRCLRTIVIFLLLGAVVNVGVAWGLASWVNPHFGGTHAAALAGPTSDFEQWFFSRKQTPVYLELDSNWLDAGVPPRRPAGLPFGDPSALVPNWLDSFRPVSTGTGRHGRMARAWGWPAISLWWESAGDAVGDVPPRLGPVGPRIHAGKMVRATPFATVSESRVLPVRPIWPNTVWNTLFYAALLVGAHQLFLASRRSFRRRRGLCPACRYPIGESEVCTECGAEVARPRVRVADANYP